jgi:hypothetical protein
VNRPLSVAELRRLQKQVGNRAVLRLVHGLRAEAAKQEADVPTVLRVEAAKAPKGDRA